MRIILRTLQESCVSAIKYGGTPDDFTFTAKVLAEVTDHTLATHPFELDKDLTRLKSRLHKVVQDFGSPVRKLDPNALKIEMMVQEFITQPANQETRTNHVYSFYKDGSGGWYIDLPEYMDIGGNKEDLAMVAGADTMLDAIAAGKSRVELQLGLAPDPDADVLELVAPSDPSTGGGDYFLKMFEGRPVNHKMWLCAVTEFIFGFLPDHIYIKRAEGHPH